MTISGKWKFAVLESNESNEISFCFEILLCMRKCFSWKLFAPLQCKLFAFPSTPSGIVVLFISIQQPLKAQRFHMHHNSADVCSSEEKRECKRLPPLGAFIKRVRWENVAMCTFRAEQGAGVGRQFITALAALADAPEKLRLVQVLASFQRSLRRERGCTVECRVERELRESSDNGE